MRNVLFGEISDTDKWVYHYTTLRVALEYILPSANLKLGRFTDVHDPRESKSWSFMVSSRGDDGPSGEEFFQIQSEATALAKDTCKVFCTTRDDPRASDSRIDYQFFRGYGRPRMWAQYADGHRGVCLVLDRSKLDSQIRARFSGDSVFAGGVEYVNRAFDEGAAFHLPYDEIRDGRLPNAIRDKVERYRGTYFFTKSEDWASELEWRWVVRGQSRDVEYVPIGDSLKAIVLGGDVPRTYDPAILAFKRPLRVRVARLHWRNGRPIAAPVTRR